MKTFYCLLCLLFIVFLPGKAQEHNDLYNHIDSLIYNSSEHDNEFITSSSESSITPSRGIHPGRSKKIQKIEPLILLDGIPTKKEELKGLSLYSIEKIEFISAGIPSQSIFGTAGGNGAIILTSKED